MAMAGGASSPRSTRLGYASDRHQVVFLNGVANLRLGDIQAMAKRPLNRLVSVNQMTGLRQFHRCGSSGGKDDIETQSQLTTFYRQPDHCQFVSQTYFVPSGWPVRVLRPGESLP